jgi:hypothetical protein
MNFLFSMGIIERIVLFVSFLIFTTTVLLLVFFDGLFSKPQVAPEDVIGNVIKLEGHVERRTPDGFNYSKLLSRDVIGNGDTVFTRSASTTSIKLINDSVIRVGPESLVVIREIDGKFNIKVDQGSLSGQLDKNAQIEVQTDDESIYLDGEFEQEFNLKTDPRGGFQRLSPAVVTQKAVESTDSNTEDGKEGRPKKSSELTDSDFSQETSMSHETNIKYKTTVPTSSKQRILLQSGSIQSQKKQSSLKYNPKSRSLATPYPSQGQMVFYKKAKIVRLYPVDQCEKSCRLDVYSQGERVISSVLQPDRIPVFDLEIAKNLAGEIKWEVKEGKKIRVGSFYLQEYSEENFAEALKRKLNIEVLD